jgi:DNA-binding MarR family transcriptional regulator
MAPGSKQSFSPLDLLHRASQRADNLFAQRVGNAQLTPRQFAVLKAVSAADGLSQTAIMAATGIDRSTTAELVRRLVNNGLLQRRRTRRDARLYAVRLTARGRQTFASGEPAARTADETLLSSLAPQQRSAFLEALALMATDQTGQELAQPIARIQRRPRRRG